MEDQAQNPEQPQQEWNPMLTFNMSLADVNVVLTALSAAPLGQAVNAYMAFRNDAERQLAVLRAAAEAEKANEQPTGE